MPNDRLILAHHLRRWPNNKPALFQQLVFDETADASYIRVFIFY